MDKWKAKTGLAAKLFCQWIGISESKLSIWRTRTGMPTAHAHFVPREDCLTQEEIDAIVDFYLDHTTDGYRRCTYMMMDQNIACASPSTVYSVLKRASALRPRSGKTGCKGKGFHQPLGPHHHWHTDITHVKVGGISANLCSIIDGYSRYCVAHRLSKNGEALDVEAVFQQGVERFPEAKGRVISDNGKQFVCKEYRELLTLSGFTYCNTSPYYPQSNGKQERFHGSLKSERLNRKHLNDFDYAEKVIDDYVDYYNNVRLHSAIGYVTPRDMLEGHAPVIQALRSQKLKDARERRRMAFQENKLSLTAHCETEDGSAGEQPSRDGSVTTTAKTVPAGNTAGVLKATVCAG
ncbi:transposase InsO family protein [Oligosphaera ethanolica]|uniref:Transposase InsO family protein n=1 Tax=Oligosphaera ethanolica TaxID=760260 RepID=A0AAE3VFI5_9BACT|nr:transposase InsO family protein [Oligosphaera ethanolica]